MHHTSSEKDCEDLHDYVLFKLNTGLRPDEANRLQFRDVKVAKDGENKETILHIDVRGKRGTGYCKSMPGAVLPFQRIMKRRTPSIRDLQSGAAKRSGPDPVPPVFPRTHRDPFNAILVEEGLKVDRDGQRRSAYSLRHIYISPRLMEGADIYRRDVFPD